MYDSSPLVKPVPPAAEAAKVEQILADVRQNFGFLPSGIALFALSPTLLENFMAQMAYYIQHPTLPADMLAMLRLYIAHDKDCPYCVSMNEIMLQNMGFSADQLQLVKKNPATAPLDEKSKALFLLVIKAISEPHQVGAADLDHVRAQGWSDQDLLDAVNHGTRAVALNLTLDTFKVYREGVF